MKNKNKSLIFFIVLVLIGLSALLVSLNQLLSESQMRKLVVDFVAKEVPGAKGDLSSVHLNFRRTLQVHFDDVKVEKGSDLNISAKHVMLSIPYGNFIFRRGKFDVRIESPIVQSKLGTTALGALKTIELLKSVPEIVGLTGEVNVKLYQPTFEPKIQILDFYRPQINRLVVNNIGRNHEMAVEVLGDLQEGERSVPYSLIGSFNLDQHTLQASLALEELALPFTGYRAHNAKLKLYSTDKGLEITGSSEDQMDVQGVWDSKREGIELTKLFLPIMSGPMGALYGGEVKNHGLSLKGFYAKKTDSLEIFETSLPLTLQATTYQSEILGHFSGEVQDYKITFVVPNQEGRLDFKFESGMLTSVEGKLTGLDLSSLENHELFKRVAMLPMSNHLEGQELDLNFENTPFDRFVLSGHLKQKKTLRNLEIRVIDSKAKLVGHSKDKNFTMTMTEFPCHILALILKKKSPEGLCKGKIDYNSETGKGKFDLKWEPNSSLSELSSMLALSMVGALEQVWDIKGKIDGDHVTIDKLGGRRFSFVGRANGSISTQSLKLDGLLTFKKKKITPVRIEISSEGVRQLNEDENAD